MPFYVYIIYSPSLDQFYIGHTQNLEDRLFRHTNSGSKSTKKAHDWVLKYTEEFSTRAEAASRELQIKNRKSRNYIETLNGSPDGYRDEMETMTTVRIFNEGDWKNITTIKTASRVPFMKILLFL